MNEETNSEKTRGLPNGTQLVNLGLSSNYLSYKPSHFPPQELGLTHNSCLRVELHGMESNFPCMEMEGREMGNHGA